MSSLPPRAFAASILLLVFLTVAVVLADGLLEIIFLGALVTVPAFAVGARSRDWTPVMTWVLIGVVGSVGAVIAWSEIDERYGSVIRAPVGGNSDQIDLTLMSWTWYRHTFPGKTRGGPAAVYVLDWYEAADDVPVRASMMERWGRHAAQDDEPFAYAYRAHAYPVMLGTAWKVVGYRPELGPVINVGLFTTAIVALTAALTFTFSLPAGIVAGLLLGTSAEPLVWAGQNMSETLSVLFVALVIAATLLLLRSSAPRWFIGLGIALGGLVLTKQMYLAVAVGWLVVLAVGLVFVMKMRASLVARRLALTIAGFAFLVLPWFAYNVAATGTSVLFSGTAGWHDMPSVYSQEYLDGEDRHDLREQLFDDHAQRTGGELRTDVDRALAGRRMWIERLSAGEYTGRFIPLFMLKAARSLAADFLGWSVRVAMVAAAAAVVAWGTRRDRVAAGLVLALPVLLLGFLGLTITSGSRMFVTSWVSVAALIGIGGDVALRRWHPDPQTVSGEVASPPVPAECGS